MMHPVSRGGALNPLLCMASSKLSRHQSASQSARNVCASTRIIVLAAARLASSPSVRVYARLPGCVYNQTIHQQSAQSVIRSRLPLTRTRVRPGSHVFTLQLPSKPLALQHWSFY